MDEIRQWLDGNRAYSLGVQLYLQHGKDSLLRMLFQEGYSSFKESKLQEVLQQLVQQPVGQLETVQQNPTTITDPVKPSDDHCCSSCADGDKCDSGLQEKVSDLKYDLHEVRDDVDDIEYEMRSLSGNVEDIQAEVVRLKKVTTELDEKAKEIIRKGWPVVKNETVKRLHDKWLLLFSEMKSLQYRIYEPAKAGRIEESGPMAHKTLDLRDHIREIYTERDYYIANGKLPDPPPDLPGLVTNPLHYPKSLANHQRYLREYKSKWRTEKNKKRLAALELKIQLQEKYVAHYKKLLGIADAV